MAARSVQIHVGLLYRKFLSLTNPLMCTTKKRRVSYLKGHIDIHQMKGEANSIPFPF